MIATKQGSRLLIVANALIASSCLSPAQPQKVVAASYSLGKSGSSSNSAGSSGVLTTGDMSKGLGGLPTRISQGTLLQNSSIPGPPGFPGNSNLPASAPATGAGAPAAPMPAADPCFQPQAMSELYVTASCSTSSGQGGSSFYISANAPGSVTCSINKNAIVNASGQSVQQCAGQTFSYIWYLNSMSYNGGSPGWMASTSLVGTQSGFQCNDGATCSSMTFSGSNLIPSSGILYVQAQLLSVFDANGAANMNAADGPSGGGFTPGQVYYAGMTRGLTSGLNADGTILTKPGFDYGMGAVAIHILPPNTFNISCSNANLYGSWNCSANSAALPPQVAKIQWSVASRSDYFQKLNPLSPMGVLPNPSTQLPAGNTVTCDSSQANCTWSGAGLARPSNQYCVSAIGLDANGQPLNPPVVSNGAVAATIACNLSQITSSDPAVVKDCTFTPAHDASGQPVNNCQ